MPVNLPPIDQLMESQLADDPSVPLAELEKADPNDDLIDREKPDPPEARKELVDEWTEKIKRAKKYWEPVFNRMKADQDFAAGYQWSKEEKDDRYIANLTLRIIAQRVAFFYAKNPKFDRLSPQAHSEHRLGRRPVDVDLAAAGRGAGRRSRSRWA